MVAPSQAEGDNFTLRPRAQPVKEPMCADDRFWLWLWAIMIGGVVAIGITIAVGVIVYQKVTTPEQMCAAHRDPPEFCRELAKRR